MRGSLYGDLPMLGRALESAIRCVEPAVYCWKVQMMPAKETPIECSDTVHSGRYGIVSGAFSPRTAKLGSNPDCLIGQVSTEKACLSSVA